jgi:hypothetical protein
MRNIQLATLATLVSLLVSSAAFADKAVPNPIQRGPSNGQQQTVDLVIALDVSSSMDGLIDSARQKLWDVVNLLAQARPQPTLRVGLISYGNDGYSGDAGWVKKDSDLTTDIDGVYSKLFALKTNGGTEYVARAVHVALGDMAWSQDPRALKIIFVAGNEPANQDPKLDVAAVMGAAKQRGVYVNTIYCGSESNGEAALWHQVATLAGGEFAAIDQNRVVNIPTPMDDQLAQLSSQLNSTYVAFGASGGAHAANQAEQDKKAGLLAKPVAAARAFAKSSRLYRNDEWDLVDARKNAKKDVAKMAPAELPEPMRAMSPVERDKYLDQKAAERDAIQKKIATLSVERQKFIDAERKRHVAGPQKALDDALGKAIKSEAVSKGYAF